MTSLDRRTMFVAGLGLGAGIATGGFATSAAAAGGPRGDAQTSVRAAAERRAAAVATPPGAGGTKSTTGTGNGSGGERLQAGALHDQSAVLQGMIDAAATTGDAVLLPAGRFVVAGIALRSGTRLVGQGAATRLVFAGGASCVTADGAQDVTLDSLVIDGGAKPLAEGVAGLAHLTGCQRLTLRNVSITHSARHGLALQRCSGRISDCNFTFAAQAGLWSLDAAGLDIEHNSVADCANNGILVWRTKSGEDNTRVTGNRIERIRAEAGGSGQNGNGINVFRAAGVLVSGNRVADCAYSAVRGNAASDIAIVGNHCTRIGEVALYAEFGFEGALIANNLVDSAACGVSVTNFNEGGRLAVVQGNLIRNIVRREQEPVDKRGEAIAVEADTVVSGNTIEAAATCGIAIGTGRYLRDVSATGNLIRNARIGILISADRAGGACQVSGNMISGARDGAIRGAEHGRAIGPDLVREPTQTARIMISGNMAV